MKYLTLEEEKKLAKVLKDSKSAGRDYAIIDLILNTGLRCQECRLLTVGDVFNKEIRQELTVQKENAKRGKARTIPLHAGIRKHLAEFIRWKGKRGETLEPDAPLFVSKKGNTISQRALQRIIERWIQQAHLEGYTTHSLRHSFAMKLRRREVNLEIIQKLLGHSSLASTGIYLEPDKTSLMDAVNRIS